MLLLLAVHCSCSRKETVEWKAGIEVATDTVAYQEVFHDWGSDELVVKENIDLNGKRCNLPKGIIINFQGGIIMNGTLVGDETRIEHSGACFDKVRILGTWNVSEISTSMFRDLSYDNSLKDVVALADSRVNNRIIIEKGEYQVTATKRGDVCIPVCDNTDLVIDGIIRLVPNDFVICYIIQAKGSHIAIRGTGTIIGDKHSHTGQEGEWGMGVSLRRAHDVCISGLTIESCWGDCIYVDDGSTNIVIEECRLDHGRRQGISVVSANGVIIRNCSITNVGGTNPEYAIDVEPDQNKKVGHVIIERVTVKGCKGGFMVYGYAENAKVGTVAIRNCRIDAEKKETIAASKCDTLLVENCDIVQHNGWGCVYSRYVDCFILKDNTLWYDKGLFYQLKDKLRPTFGKKRIKCMDIDSCRTTTIVQNKERKL